MVEITPYVSDDEGEENWAPLSSRNPPSPAVRGESASSLGISTRAKFFFKSRRQRPVVRRGHPSQDLVKIGVPAPTTNTACEARASVSGPKPPAGEGPQGPEKGETAGARSAPLHRDVLCVRVDCGDPTRNIRDCAPTRLLKSEPVWNPAQKGRRTTPKGGQLESNQQPCKFCCNALPLSYDRHVLLQFHCYSLYSN